MSNAVKVGDLVYQRECGYGFVTERLYRDGWSGTGVRCTGWSGHVMVRWFKKPSWSDTTTTKIPARWLTLLSEGETK